MVCQQDIHLPLLLLFVMRSVDCHRSSKMLVYRHLPETPFILLHPPLCYLFAWFGPIIWHVWHKSFLRPQNVLSVIVISWINDCLGPSETHQLLQSFSSRRLLPCLFGPNGNFCICIVSDLSCKTKKYVSFYFSSFIHITELDILPNVKIL